jgi:hypothetical protein
MKPEAHEQYQGQWLEAARNRKLKENAISIPKTTNLYGPGLYLVTARNQPAIPPIFITSNITKSEAPTERALCNVMRPPQAFA